MGPHQLEVRRRSFRLGAPRKNFCFWLSSVIDPLNHTIDCPDDHDDDLHFNQLPVAHASVSACQQKGWKGDWQKQYG